MTGTLDRLLKLILIVMRHAGDAARENLTSFSNELLEGFNVFIIDVFDFVGRKRAYLALFGKNGLGRRRRSSLGLLRCHDYLLLRLF